MTLSGKASPLVSLANIDGRLPAYPAELCAEAKFGIAAVRAHQNGVERISANWVWQTLEIELPFSLGASAGGAEFRNLRQGVSACLTGRQELHNSDP